MSMQERLKRAFKALQEVKPKFKFITDFWVEPGKTTYIKWGIVYSGKFFDGDFKARWICDYKDTKDVCNQKRDAYILKSLEENIELYINNYDKNRSQTITLGQ